MTMAVYNRTVTDGDGNVVPTVHIEVRREVPGQPLASLFSDRAGVTPLGNPFDTGTDGKISFFAAGGALRVRAYLGASGAPTMEQILRYEAIGLSAESDAIAVKTQRIVTASGAVTADVNDDIIIINKTVGAATTVNVDWSSRSKALTIVDGKGDAATNLISIVPTTGQTQYAIVDYVVTIDQNGAQVTLTPLADGTGAF